MKKKSVSRYQRASDLNRAPSIISDRSYGIVPVKQIKEKWHFLLIKHIGGHWSFPKGHPEGNENSKDTAKRELLEETGLELDTFYQKEPLKESYTFFHAGKQINKSVFYYLALVKNGEMKLQEEEVLDGGWYSYEQAMEVLSFERSREICCHSYRYLTNL